MMAANKKLLNIMQIIKKFSEKKARNQYRNLSEEEKEVKRG